MSSSNRNKHGLSRYIKTEVKEQIRREAGFGCVFCGCILVEYEHIEPEFHGAEVHDPTRMTLLCPICHDKVTKRIISKRKVWEAKQNPKALERGYVNDMLMVATENLELLLLDDKTLLVWEPPLQLQINITVYCWNSREKAIIPFTLGSFLCSFF